MREKEQDLLEEILKKEAGYYCDYIEREIKGLWKIFKKEESCIFFNVYRKNLVILKAKMYLVGHMQDSVLNVLHIFTHLVFLISL